MNGKRTYKSFHYRAENGRLALDAPGFGARPERP